MQNDPNAKTELERKLEEELRAETESETKSGIQSESMNEDDIVAADIAVDDGELVEDIPEAQVPTVESIARELEASQDQLLRMRAEFDNYRKRMARESDRIRKRAAESLIMDLLPVVDNLELALHHADDSTGGLVEGVAMVVKQLDGLLGEHGLSAIAAVGEKFDPRVHEAVSQLESHEHERDVIAQEFQRGYMLGEQVLRPSKVAVSKGAPETINDTAKEDAADQAQSSETQAAGAGSSGEKEQSNG